MTFIRQINKLNIFIIYSVDNNNGMGLIQTYITRRPHNMFEVYFKTYVALQYSVLSITLMQKHAYPTVQVRPCWAEYQIRSTSMLHSL